MGTINNFLEEISRDIDDFRGTEFVYSDYNGVPNRSDNGLLSVIEKQKKVRKLILVFYLLIFGIQFN